LPDEATRAHGGRDLQPQSDEARIFASTYKAVNLPALVVVPLLYFVGQEEFSIRLGIGLALASLAWIPFRLEKLELAQAVFLFGLASGICFVDASLGGHAVDVAAFFYFALPFTLRPSLPVRKIAPWIVLSIVLAGLLFVHPWPQALEIDTAGFSRTPQLIIGALCFANLVAVMVGMHHKRVLMVDDLHKSAAKAQEASIAKSAFLANMSHELRTPMTAIIGYTDLLRTADLTTEQTDQAEVIGRNSRHLLALLNDILDLSKIEADKMGIELASESPAQLVADAVSVVRVQAQEKGLPLRVDFVGKLPRTIQTDGLRLRQALLNLLSNAVKFSDSGEVRITVRLDKVGSNAVLAFDVTDSGPGIPENQHEDIFDPFVQADLSMQKRFEGTGLGLALTRRLAELLGGDVSLRSKLGQGSTFVLTIDLGPWNALDERVNVEEIVVDREKALTPGPTEDLSALHAMRVLVAEDGEDNRALLDLYLRRFGADPTFVTNGFDAVRKMGSPKGTAHFDAILMDMRMPKLDGYSATKQLRSQGHTLPIIALTAHAMANDEKRCLDAGCSGYLSKPFRPGELVAALVAQRPPGAGSKPEVDLPVDAKAVPNAELAGQLNIMAQKFSAGLPARLSEIEAAIRQGDTETASAVAHTIVGIAGTFGYHEVGETARLLEVALDERGPDVEVESALTEFKEAVSKARQ